jgi:hypothetical protein
MIVSTGERTRTVDLRIMRPRTESRNASRSKALRQSESVDVHNLPTDSPFPPDLAEIVTAWPNLPEALKAGIVAMVRAAKV